MKKVNLNNFKKTVNVVRRADIPAFTEVKIHGITESLGIIKDFRKVEHLADFIPGQSRLSLSWVRLENGEILKNHHHPTSSMIIVCEGKGELRGDQQCTLKAGDIVAVPAGAIHGFCGIGQGFWALSLQFEGSGLYENPEQPRVGFGLTSAPNSLTLEDLIIAQNKATDIYSKSELLQLVGSAALKDESIKARLLDALQCWSDHFQRILYTRVTFAKQPLYKQLAIKHLSEEVGHHDILHSSRDGRPRGLQDATIDGAAAWFIEQMIFLSDAERTVIIHFVLEGSSLVFSNAFKDYFEDSQYFSIHSVADEDHFQMGVDFLEKENDVNYEILHEVLDKAWAMITLLCDRMAELALSGEHK